MGGGKREEARAFAISDFRRSPFIDKSSLEVTHHKKTLADGRSSTLRTPPQADANAARSTLSAFVDSTISGTAGTCNVFPHGAAV